jgi:hypothetical protein
MDITDPPRRWIDLRESPDDGAARRIYGRAMIAALALGALVLLASSPRPAGAAVPPAAVASAKPTKAEFVRRLARLCDDRHRAVMSLGVPFTSPRDYASRGSDLMRIERNFDDATSALPRPAAHRAIDRAAAAYERYRHRLPRLVAASRRHARRAWLLMYRAQGFLTYASDLIQAYGGRRFCDLGP